MKPHLQALHLGGDLNWLYFKRQQHSPRLSFIDTVSSRCLRLQPAECKLAIMGIWLLSFGVNPCSDGSICTWNQLNHRSLSKQSKGQTKACQLFLMEHGYSATATAPLSPKSLMCLLLFAKRKEDMWFECSQWWSQNLVSYVVFNYYRHWQFLLYPDTKLHTWQS